MGLGGAAVEAVLCEKLVVVHALFVLLEHLVLRSHLGDARDYYLHLAHRRVLLDVQEDVRFLPLEHDKHVHVFFFPAARSARGQLPPPGYDVLWAMTGTEAADVS